jgi:signal transduction histidine kinase
VKNKILLILILILEISSNKTFAYTTADTIKINELNSNSLNLAYSDPTKALEIVKKTINYSRKVNFPKGEIQALIRRGIIYDVLSDTKNALKAYDEALLIARKVDYKKGEGSILNNIGLIYMNQHNLSEARIYFQKAFEIFETLKNDQLLSSISNNLGMIYEETKRDKNAIFWFRKALNYAAKIDDKLEKANIYANIGDLYNGKLIDSALHYNFKALEIYEEEGNQYYLGKSYNNIALIYSATNKGKEAEKYYLKSYKISKKIGNKFMLVSTGYNLSQLYYLQKNSKKEIETLNEIYPLIEKEGMPEIAYKVCQAIAIWNYRNGSLEKADIYFNEYLKYHAAYFDEKSNQNLTEIEKKYEVQKKEQENALLKKSIQLKSLNLKKNQQNSIIQNLIWTAGFAFISFVFLLVYFWYRRKSYQKDLENQKAIFEATLAERKRISFDLHDNVGSQLSYVVNNLEMLNSQSKNSSAIDFERVERTFKMSQDAIDSLRDTVWALHIASITIEILSSKLESYVRKMTEDQKTLTYNFVSKITNNKVISPEQTMHMFRIFQESINNIIKHAKATKIDIVIEETNDGKIVLQVSDNGIGIQNLSSPDGHFGLKNMSARATEIGAFWKIERNENGGTTVYMEV